MRALKHECLIFQRLQYESGAFYHNYPKKGGDVIWHNVLYVEHQEAICKSVLLAITYGVDHAPEQAKDTIQNKAPQISVLIVASIL